MEALCSPAGNVSLTYSPSVEDRVAITWRADFHVTEAASIVESGKAGALDSCSWGVSPVLSTTIHLLSSNKVVVRRIAGVHGIAVLLLVNHRYPWRLAGDVELVPPVARDRHHEQHAVYVPCGCE